MRKAYAAALIAVFFWGTIATTAKLLSGGLSTMEINFYTCLASSLMLLLYSIKKGTTGKLFHLPLRTVLRMTAIGALGVFIYNTGFYLGTMYLPAQQAMVINDLWPALIIVFSVIILHEKLTIGKALAVLLSFAGIVVVVTDCNFASLQLGDPRGILGCLCAAVSYSLYSVLSKRERYDKTLAVLVSFLSASLFSFVGTLPGGGPSLPTSAETLGLLYNGLICNAAPYLLWNYALDNGNTAVVANLAYLAPFVSLLTTHFVLGERITVFSVLGLLLIVGGILLQYYMEEIRKKA